MAASYHLVWVPYGAGWTMGNLSGVLYLGSPTLFSATANCSGERRRARAAMGGQAVWMEWVVWWRGVGQVVSEAQVTAGYLARRESTSGGHWDTGGGGGEPRGGVTGRWAETLAEATTLLFILWMSCDLFRFSVLTN